MRVTVALSRLLCHKEITEVKIFWKKDRNLSQTSAVQFNQKVPLLKGSCQSPVHENGAFYSEVVQWKQPRYNTEVERKYTEVAARGTPVYFPGN